jgi:hypothetical protein
MIDDRIQLQHKPGEKIQVNCPEHWAHGLYGIIRTPCLPFWHAERGEQVSAHLVELADGRIHNPDGTALLFAPFELDMIESEDRQTTSWDDCVWSPPNE